MMLLLMLIIGCYYLGIIHPATLTDDAERLFVCASNSTCGAACQLYSSQHRQNYSHGWAVRHHSLGQHYNRFNCKVAIEIGIARAELSKYLLDNVGSIREYYALDPFLGGYDKTDAMSEILLQHNASDVWSQSILNNLREFGCRFRLFHGFSADAAKFINNASVDCIFIDGDHTYGGVKLDINLFFSKLAINGYMIFDDYSWQFPGVIKAVDELVYIHKIPLMKINKHNNYYFQKTK